MGGGGLFFSKPLANYNILNDYDSSVINAYNVMQFKSELLYNFIGVTPIHIDIFNFERQNYKNITLSGVERAAYFLILSSYSLYGTMITLRMTLDNSKAILLESIKNTYKFLVSSKTKFLNCDLGGVISKITIRDEFLDRTQLYSDPPYLDTSNNYDTGKCGECDVIKCFDATFDSIVKGFRLYGAMSEFDHPFIIKTAEERGLFINYVCERTNIKNVRTEILITNYEVDSSKFF